MLGDPSTLEHLPHGIAAAAHGQPSRFEPYLHRVLDGADDFKRVQQVFAPGGREEGYQGIAYVDISLHSARRQSVTLNSVVCTRNFLLIQSTVDRGSPPLT